MRVAAIIALAFLSVPAQAGQLSATVSRVTAAEVDDLSATRERSLVVTSVAASGATDDARLSGLRAAMDGMSLLEPDDVLELRAAIRHGARPTPALRAALSRLDAVEARADARVLAAVSGPTPVRLDGAADDLAPMVAASR